MTEVESPAWSMLAVSSLVENPHNYRKTSDEKADAELAASIREKGVLQPLLVRPLDGRRGRYEVVIGNRRLRACRTAELVEVPCTIREMSDAEALTVALIENVQRADVHPIEEADGFRELITAHGFTIAEVAAKTGRSEHWVRSRLKLAELDASGRRACLDGKISVGVALLCARTVPASLQAQAVRDLVQAGRYGDDGPCSLSHARRILLAQYATELRSVPWKLEDAELVPEAGACSVCPKRSKNDKSLFADLERADVCTDGSCFKTKMTAHWKHLSDKARARGARVLTEKESEKILGRGYVNSAGFADATSGTGSWDSKGNPITWGQAAKKAGAEIVLAQDPTGRPVELVELTSAVKKAAKVEREARSPKVAKAEKAADQKAKRRAAMLRLASAQIVDQVERAEGLAGLRHPARLAVLRVAVDNFWSDVHRKAEQRRGIDAKDGLGKWCEGASPEQIEGLIAELALLRVAADFGGSGNLAKLLEAFGLSERDLNRQVAAAEKAAEKEQAEQRKKAAKEKAKKGGRRKAAAE